MPSDERRRAAARRFFLSLSLSLSLTSRTRFSLHPLRILSSRCLRPRSSRNILTFYLRPSSASLPSAPPRTRLRDCTVVVVVADTSRGLTCHTRSAAAPLRHPDRTLDRSPSRVAPLGSWARPPGCIGTPAAIAVGRGPWAERRAPTQVMHGPSYIFHPLPLLSHRLRERIALYPFPFSPFSPSSLSLSLSLSLCLLSLLSLCVRLVCICSSPAVLVAPCERRRVVCTVHTSNILDPRDALQRLLLSVLLQVCDRHAAAARCQLHVFPCHRSVTLGPGDRVTDTHSIYELISLFLFLFLFPPRVDIARSLNFFG